MLANISLILTFLAIYTIGGALIGGVTYALIARVRAELRTRGLVPPSTVEPDMQQHYKRILLILEISTVVLTIGVAGLAMQAIHFLGM